MDTDTRRKSAWTSLFRRRGGEQDGSVRLWSDWNDEIRQRVLGSIDLEPEELPVILIGAGSSTQVLLTTRRLFLQPHNIPLSGILGVKAVEMGEKRKNQLDEIEISTSEGSTRIRLEPGSSFFAMWSVLLNIAQRNQHRLQSDG